MCRKQSKEKQKKPRSKARRIIRAVFLTVALITFAFVAFFAVKILNLDAWNEFDPQKIIDTDSTLIIYDKNGSEAVRLDCGEDRIPVSLEKVPKIVQKAFISAEDARFYEHNGIDIVRIFGALWQDIKAGGYVQGASTISQQLIKLSHLTSDKTITRKLEEAVLAYQMEKQYSKDEILEMYLNYVYFGGGYYGIEAAALGYFGVHCEELTVEQGATLAAVLKSPSKYAPHLYPEASKERRNLVLSLMQEYGHLSDSDADKARSTPLNIIVNQEQPKRGYYIDEAIKEACEFLNISNEELLRGGYRIYTCMNTELQAYCEELFEAGDVFADMDCEAALVIQSTDGGCIEAMIGGRDNSTAMAFNRAVDIKRQPGSVIKPVICYAPALESGGYTAASMIVDEKCEFGDYAPNNYGNKYYGCVTLREAVKRSLNIPAVKVLSDITVDRGKAFAKHCGIEFDESDTSLSLALGGFTYGVSPLGIAGAYSVFASGGVYNKPILIREIRNNSDELLYSSKNIPVRVMSEQNAYILTSMLQSAITEGTGRRLGELGIPLAGKTGTVDEGNAEGNRDAWMAAYNSEHTAVVWMGYDSSKDGKALPAEATGGKYPAMILKSVFSKLYEKDSAPDFIMPEGIKEVKLDERSIRVDNKVVLASALTPKAGIISELFVAGTEPVEESGYWEVPATPKKFSVKLSSSGKPQISFDAYQSFALYRLYRKSEGKAMLMGEWKGGSGLVTFIDTNAKENTVYNYYVVPYHQELFINSKQVFGNQTEVLSVKTPETIYFGTDETEKNSKDGF